MITCSKCEKQFHVDWRSISKDSTIPCSHCGHECLVTLFDLQNHSEESGFKGVNSKTYEEIKQEEEKESKSLHDHLLIIIVILNLFLAIFIFGMYNIEYLEEKFPAVGKCYNGLNIFAHKRISVSSFSIERKDQLMVVNLNLVNQCGNSELLNDIQILVGDHFNNTIAATHIKPNKIIKGEEVLPIKINIVGVTEDARKISIFINGKIAFEEKLDK